MMKPARWFAALNAALLLVMTQMPDDTSAWIKIGIGAVGAFVGVLAAESKSARQ